MYIHTQLPPPGGITSNCLGNDQGYYVDLITLLIKLQMVRIGYLRTYVVNSTSINTIKLLLDSYLRN